MSPRTKIGVLVSGGGTNLQAVIDNIHGKSGDIAVVISNRSKAYGLERARQSDIPAVFISSKETGTVEVFNKEILKALKEHDVELVVLAGYLKILSEEFVKTFENRIINIHPALIPAFCGVGYYGLKVHEAAIEYGVKLSGATVHFVNAEADNGPIIMQKTVPVKAEDTPESLQQRVLGVEHEILVESVRKYCEGKISVAGRLVRISD